MIQDIPVNTLCVVNKYDPGDDSVNLVGLGMNMDYIRLSTNILLKYN